MRGDIQAIDQLTIGPNPLAGTCGVEWAQLDGKESAQFGHCPARWAVRWLWMDWRERGSTTIYPTRDAAIEAMRLWVTGLDIVPLDAWGKSEVF